MSETARERLARHLGMGSYGYELAQEILDQYASELGYRSEPGRSTYSRNVENWARDVIEKDEEGNREQV